MVLGARPPLQWRELEPTVVDPKATVLCRLYSWPGGEWDEPEPKYRSLRVDPPGEVDPLDPRKHAFAVLYTATRLDTIAQECGILTVDGAGRWTLNESQEERYNLARYEFDRPGIFISIDEPNATRLGLDDSAVMGEYAPYQELALDLFQSFGHIAHGLCWRSFHRRQSGPVYAIWHSRKADLGLARPTTCKLKSDPEWIDVLSRTPNLQRLAAP